MARGVRRGVTWIVLGLVVGGCSSGADAKPGVASGVPGSPDDDTDEGTDEGTRGASTGATTGSSTSGDGSQGVSSTGIVEASTSTGATQAGIQSFDDDPGWVSFNLPLGGNDYGWRPTAVAGGDPGEIGGVFQAPMENAYYADLGIEAPNTAAIVASGVLDIVAVDGDYNYNTFFGHFSSADPDGSRLGFEILEPNAGGAARVRIQHGTGSVETFVVTELGIDRDWSYAYDPDEAEFGGITLMLEGQGVESYDLSAEDRVAIESLDAFGFVTRQSANAGVDTGLLEAYIDDVEYTH